MTLAYGRAVSRSGTTYNLGQPWPEEEPLPKAAEDALVGKGGDGCDFTSVEQMHKLVEELAALCRPEHAATPEEIQVWVVKTRVAQDNRKW